MFEKLITTENIDINGKKRKILAHNGKNYTETYKEHISKTKEFFKFLLDQDGVIDQKTFNKLREQYDLTIDYKDFKNILLSMIEYHDFGKFNPKFQKNKLRNKDFEDIDIPEDREIYSHHSIIGSIYHSIHLYENYDLNQDPILLIFPHIILGHHTNLKSLYESEKGPFSVNSEYSEYLNTIGYFHKNLIENEDQMREFNNKFSAVSSLYGDLKSTVSVDDSLLSFLYNYFYSVIVKADSIASSYADKSISQFRSEMDDFYRRITPDQVRSIEEGFEAKQEEYEAEMDQSPLNPVRNEMQEEAVSNLNVGLEKDKRIFYLKMPTGGGKTHTAIGLGLDILDKTGSDRIIYSLPYISLLRQNFDYVQEVTNLEKGEDLRAIYSASEIPDKDQEDLKNLMTFDDFYEYPLICTTTVSLFGSIVNFDKSSMYRFSSLANSVIVIDEIQTLPTAYWPEFNYLLNELAEILDSYIVIMSATVPSLNELKTARGQDPEYESEAWYLIDDPEEYYESFDRNSIVSDDVEEIRVGDDDIDDLVGHVMEICQNNFMWGNNHGLVVVNTVRMSRNLYDELEDELSGVYDDFELLLLNSTFTTAKKKEIKDRIDEMDEDKKIVLISTQSIEAGMDVSFNFVIRDYATLESIEQVRGRCNREMDKGHGNVYLMEIRLNGRSEAEKIYLDWKLDRTRNVLVESGFEYGVGDVDRYFDECIDYINSNIYEKFGLSSQSNIECWNKIKYEERSSSGDQGDVFHVDIIEEDFTNHSFFVELDIKKELFTNKEIEYLESKESEYRGLELFSDGKVRGDRVLELYQRELEVMEGESYSRKKVLKKRFSSVLSKFTFTSYTPVEEDELRNQLREVGPYIIIGKQHIGETEEHLYSKERGFNREILNEL